MTVSEVAKLMGARGGKARAENLTKEERSAGARKAALARWKGHKGRKAKETDVKYKTFSALLAAYKSGEITEPLVIDNERCYVFVGPDEARERVFRMELSVLLEVLLEGAGVPWEYA